MSSSTKPKPFESLYTGNDISWEPVNRIPFPTQPGSGLYLGSKLARSPVLLKKHGITRVLCLCMPSERRLLESPLPPGVQEAWIVLDDWEGTRVFPSALRAAVAQLEGWFAQDPAGAVLVHCIAGISRSAAMVMGYLIKAHGMAAQAAFTCVEQARPCINPRLSFQQELCVFEQECAGNTVIVQ